MKDLLVFEFQDGQSLTSEVDTDNKHPVQGIHAKCYYTSKLVIHTVEKGAVLVNMSLVQSVYVRKPKEAPVG